jgi:hypothetical protein
MGSIGALKAASLLKIAAPQLQNETVQQREVVSAYCQSIARTLEEIRFALITGRRPTFALAKLQGLAWNFPKTCRPLNGLGAEQWGKELVARWPQGDLVELMHESTLGEEFPKLYAQAAAAFDEIAEAVRCRT